MHCRPWSGTAVDRLRLGCGRAGRPADGGVDPMGWTSHNAEMAGGCATAIAVKVVVRDECDESGGEHRGAE